MTAYLVEGKDIPEEVSIRRDRARAGARDG
jgi:hypothetical protein